MNKATALRVGCAGILEAEVAGIFSKSTSLDDVSLKTQHATPSKQHESLPEGCDFSQ